MGGLGKCDAKARLLGAFRAGYGPMFHVKHLHDAGRRSLDVSRETSARSTLGQ